MEELRSVTLPVGRLAVVKVSHPSFVSGEILSATSPSHSQQFILMWASALCIHSTIIPSQLTDPQQFHYCTDSNPGIGADDAFVLKLGVWRNATWPSHSRPAIAASPRHFQICFLPEYFDRLFVYLLFVYLVLFMHQAMSNIFWHLRMFI